MTWLQVWSWAMNEWGKKKHDPCYYQRGVWQAELSVSSSLITGLDFKPMGSDAYMIIACNHPRTTLKRRSKVKEFYLHGQSQSFDPVIFRKSPYETGKTNYSALVSYLTLKCRKNVIVFDALKCNFCQNPKTFDDVTFQKWGLQETCNLGSLSIGKWVNRTKIIWS